MKKLLFLLIALIVPVCACGNSEGMISYEEETEYSVDALDLGERTLDEPVSIYVSVTGCVNDPGVYILPEGSRVFEALNAAGGVTEDAATERLNLVNIIKDGTTINVPAVKEIEEALNSGFEDGVILSESDSSKININTASVDKLSTLPGIGMSKSKAIVAYREKNGSFKSIEDIKNVSGIKDGVFESIKDSIVAD